MLMVLPLVQKVLCTVERGHTTEVAQLCRCATSLSILLQIHDSNMTHYNNVKE
jgi:hypothetical protein